MMELDEFYKVEEQLGAHGKLSFESKIEGLSKFGRTDSSSMDVGMHLKVSKTQQSVFRQITFH